MGGATRLYSSSRRIMFHFNPRSPWGERLWKCSPQNLPTRNFNPRSPWGERRYRPASHQASMRDFNPRSPWGERLGESLCILFAHAFQSTLPVGGATAASSGRLIISSIFQSTLPVGGATRLLRFPAFPPRYFNPRSPWGERHQAGELVGMMPGISIHAPRGGSDK